MSKNNAVVPQARAALDQFKMEAAREVDVQSHQKYFKPVITYLKLISFKIKNKNHIYFFEQM